jgi:hypothetical protein
VKFCSTHAEIKKIELKTTAIIYRLFPISSVPFCFIIIKITSTLLCNLNMANYLNYGKLSICILIREGKPLYPFLSKLRARRVVRFGIVKVYVEKECRKIKFMYDTQGVPKKRDKSIAPLFIGGF